MGDDALDADVIVVGRRLRRGQHIFVVEDVEPLVLHRPHIEIGDGDDVETVEIIFAPEGALVPGHRALERIHRVSRATLAAGLDVDAERDPPPRHGDETVSETGKIAGDDGKEIAGLLERIAPDRPVTPTLALAGGFEIAIGEQHRRFRLVRLEPHAIGREHVGPVGEVGDAAKALRLALRAIGRARTIEPHQLSVGGRIQNGLKAQRERPTRRTGQREAGGRSLEGAGGERRPIERGGDQIELVAVELQRRVRAPIGMRAHRQRRDNPRRVGP